MSTESSSAVEEARKPRLVLQLDGYRLVETWTGDACRVVMEVEQRDSLGAIFWYRMDDYCSGGSLQEFLQQLKEYLGKQANGVELIAQERFRQLTKYQDARDDTHVAGELANAAALYAIQHTDMGRRSTLNDLRAHDMCGLRNKPAMETTHRLAIAGALIAAEIDRLQRAAAKAEVKR